MVAVKKRPESMPLDAGSDVYYEDSTASLKERLERAEAVGTAGREGGGVRYKQAQVSVSVSKPNIVAVCLW